MASRTSSNRATKARVEMARALRESTLSWVTIAARLREKWPELSVMASVRIAHGWREKDVADRWAERWPHDRLLATEKLSEWERWPDSGQQPSLRALGKLAELYDCNLSHLVEGLSEFATSDAYDGDVDRRDFMRTSGVAGLTLLLPADPRSGDHPPAQNVGMTEVRHERDKALRLCFADRRNGGRAVYRAVLAHRDNVHTLVRTASYRENVGRNLQSVLGHLTYLAGFCAFDAGRTRLAGRHFDEALRIAQVARDDRLAVQTLDWYSYMTALAGSGRDAVQMAQAAAEAARGFATPRLTSRIATSEAVGRARAGDPVGFARAATHAEHALDSDADDPDAEGWWLSRQGWDHASTGYRTAAALALLDDLDRAERSARVAVGQCDPGYPRSQALFSARLATVLAQAGKIDEAAAVTTSTLAMLDGINSGRTERDLQGLLPSFEAHPGNDRARDAAEALRLHA